MFPICCHKRKGVRCWLCSWGDKLWAICSFQWSRRSRLQSAFRRRGKLNERQKSSVDRHTQTGRNISTNNCQTVRACRSVKSFFPSGRCLPFGSLLRFLFIFFSSWKWMWNLSFRSQKIIILKGSFDAIIASNLLCRLPSPRKFLRDISSFIKPDGVLILISPYSWLEEYTPKSERIGGLEDGKDSATEVEKFLLQNSPLKLVHRENIPFLIREHERKYQYGVSYQIAWFGERSRNFYSKIVIIPLYKLLKVLKLVKFIWKMQL